MASTQDNSSSSLVLLLLFLVVVSHSSAQLERSQFQALVRIKHQLNYPEELSRWTENQDSCNSEPTRILSLACYQDNLTQLYINGDTFPHPLNISLPALFSNIAAFPTLKVLSLTSLALTGPLPPEIGRLSSLEILNLTSNSFTGSIPAQILSMKNLHTLIMDYNGFTGNVPAWIGSFQELTVLSLRNNSFTGSFPDTLSGLLSLRALALSGNRLSGQVPGLHNLTNLQLLDLGDNNLGPGFPSLPTRLVSLSLRRNGFHSAVGDELGSCYQLQRLDVSLNQLVGAFPASIIALPSLIYLDISRNKFTGKLQHNTSCNAMLKFANLSENRLTGDLPDCLRGGVVLYDGNCLSEREHRQHPVPFCHSEALAVGISPHPHGRHDDDDDEKRVALGIAGGITGGLLVVGIAFFLAVRTELWNRNNEVVSRTRLVVDKVSPAFTLQLLKDARYIANTKKLGALGIPPYRTFVVDELKEATSNFDPSNLIGEGSSGQVYKGWLTDGTMVAIRSFKVNGKKHSYSYLPQLELIVKLRHSHLVSSIGHCVDYTTIFLVFEYVPNGTLRTHVSEHKLSWKQRIAAGIGVARGIQFLHTGIVPGVYANNVKITDILLDQDYNVKIKLPLLTQNPARLLMDDGEAGSKEQGLGELEKSDVYDLGVILLELIVGRAIVSSNDINVSKDILSVGLAANAAARRTIVDPTVHKECSDESVRTLVELCTRCLSQDPSERPSVEDIMWNLQYAAQVQDTRESPAHTLEII